MAANDFNPSVKVAGIMPLQTLKPPSVINSNCRNSPHVDAHAVKLFACAIERIVDQATGKPLGWVYEWNNGEKSEFWIGGEQRQNVVYVSRFATFGNL